MVMLHESIHRLRIQQFNAVNLIQGYRLLEIRSPRELFVEEDNDGGGDGEA
jgi:hypothetical protein